jgi:hypothetical protein
VDYFEKLFKASSSCESVLDIPQAKKGQRTCINSSANRTD